MNVFEYLRDKLQTRDDSEYIVCNTFNFEVFDNLKQDGFLICLEKPPQNLYFCEYVQIGKYVMIKKAFKPIDWLNDDGTFSFTNSNEPLYRRLLPPPPETVNHTFLISAVISENNPSSKSYIEYGVRSCENLKYVSTLVEQSYAVDIADCSSNMPEKCTFYRMLTNEFSTTILPELTYHFAFIDADHKHESVLQDFEHIYRHIQPGGYIFLHDTYPCDESFLSPQGSYDCYKTPSTIRGKYPNIELVNIPLNPGLCIVRKSD